MDGCLACDLAEGRLPLPGGRIHETTHWLVEHCVGPLAVGTLIVKPAATWSEWRTSTARNRTSSAACFEQRPLPSRR
jgi:hypothetical protein